MKERISNIIDPRTGQPFVYASLAQEIAAPSLGSVRSPISLAASSNLTPERLARMLRGAEEDDPEAYLSLAEEMEEKDLHYLSVLGTRKRQVSQLPITLSSASKDAPDEAIAKDVQESLIDTGVIDAAVFDMLDAVGKGFSLTEILWKMGADKWVPVRLKPVNPRFVRFDRIDRATPLLLTNQGEREPLAPFKFVWLELKAKSGIPIRGGMARPVAWAWMFKNYAVKDWVQFCEVYGIPWRIGSYDQSASQADKDALLRAVCSLSSDAAAIKPKNMDIQVVESGGKTASSDLYFSLAKFLDDQISKAVLGQTATVDATPGKLGSGQDATEVREDIERADAKALSAAINKFVIRAFVDVNYGPQERYPAVAVGRVETKNAQLMVDAAAKLSGQMKIRAADIREAVGFAEPQDNDELIAAPMPAAPPFGIPGGLPAPANDIARQAIAAARRNAALLAAEMFEGGDDAIAIAARTQAVTSAQILTPLRDAILKAAAASSGFEEFRRRLQVMKPDDEISALADHVALLTFQAVAGGIVGDTLKNQPGR